MARYEGMLAWLERFDRKFDRDMAFEIGDYGYASQYQQSPVPRKGGILKREYWQAAAPRSRRDAGAEGNVFVTPDAAAVHGVNAIFRPPGTQGKRQHDQSKIPLRFQILTRAKMPIEPSRTHAVGRVRITYSRRSRKTHKLARC
jgi:hypothetical protein